MKNIKNNIARLLDNKSTFVALAVLGLGILGFALFSFYNSEEPKSYTEMQETQLINATISDDASAEDKASHEIMKARQYLKIDEKEAALDHYRRALQYTPNDSGLLVNTADLASELEKEDAKELYQRAFTIMKEELEGDNLSSVYYSLGLIAEKAGSSEAKEFFEKAVQLGSESNDEEMQAFGDLAAERLKNYE